MIGLAMVWKPKSPFAEWNSRLARSAPFIGLIVLLFQAPERLRKERAEDAAFCALMAKLESDPQVPNDGYRRKVTVIGSQALGPAPLERTLIWFRRRRTCGGCGKRGRGPVFHKSTGGAAKAIEVTQCREQEHHIQPSSVDRWSSS